MKMIIVLLTAACLQVSAGGYSQTVTLSVKNATLESVLRKVKKQTGYDFFFETKLVKQARNLNLDVKNQPLEKVLNLCFENQSIGYKITDQTIIVTEKERMLKPAVSTPLPPPVIDVKGKVTDENGAPIEGVSVLVKTTNKGTATNAAGEWELKAVNDNAVLVFSYVGFISREVALNGKNTITVTLLPSNTKLEEVVVVGYGTQRKRDLTGSITSVKGDDLAKMPATNPVSSLQGKVAGLTVINSGRAGASPTVRIRGVNSTNNSDPLFVVDGVFQTNIDYLNPTDIESIEVLRDPSSIAIFGLQGGNGVIIVTTKRAAKGKTRIAFQSAVSLQKVNDKIAVTDADGFKKLYNAQLTNIGAAPFDYTNYTANTNWQNLILRDAVMTTNGLSISNNGEKSSTLLTLGYNNQDGVLKYDNFQKYIVRLSEEIKINKQVRIGGDITGFHWIQQGPQENALNYALRAAPIAPVQLNENTYYSMPSFQRAQVANPVALLNRSVGNNINKGYRMIGSLFAEVKFLDHFTFKSTVYTDLGFNNSRSYTPLPYSFVNLGEGAIPTTTTFDQSARTSVSQAQAEFRKFQQDHTLTYDRTFNQDHHLTALAGFSTLFAAGSNITGNRKDTLLNIPNDPAFWYLGIAGANNPGTYSGIGNEEAYMSFLGRVSYTYQNKYLLNVTYRRDGTSKFSPGNRWGNFNSVGAGWVISEENFMKTSKVLDFLKLRASWGQVGNVLGTGSYLYLPILNTSSIGVFGNNVYNSVSPDYVPDPNLHWEVVNGIDLGLEFRTLNNRLSGDINLYDRTTKDILTLITLPGTAGDYRYYTNLGNISNRGIEITLGWQDKIGKDFQYAVSSNFSYNKNNVKSIGNNINFQLLGNNGANKTETGNSIGYFYGYRQTGIYQSTADMDKMARMPNSLPGDIAYADVNGDGQITPADRTYLGTPFPTFNFGINISMSYKGFDAILEGQGVAGNKVYTQRRTGTFATLNYETNRLNAWTTPGSSNIEPVLDITRANNFLFSSYYLEPGDYFRLRTVQLGYTFGPNALAKAGVKQLRLYLSAQNLRTFSRTTGYTPEAAMGNPIASGADNGTYPVPAVYSFGLNITF